MNCFYDSVRRLALVLAAGFVVGTPLSRAAAGSEEEAGRLQLDEDEIKRIVDQYLRERDAQEAAEDSGWESFRERFSFGGDGRVRLEDSFFQDSQQDRFRMRLRLRLAAGYEISDNLTVGTRLVTGDADDPNSPHWTLGTGFDGIEISLDRAFVTWAPDFCEGSAVTAGKFAHPFVTNPVYGELVWDQDVQPEGAYFRHTENCDGTVSSLSFVAGQYILIEQGNADDAYSTVAQVSANLALSDDVTGTAALGYYWYGRTTPNGSATLLADNAGNSLVDTDGNGTPDEFESEFGILHPILGIKTKVGDTPVQFGGEYIYNHRAHNDRDSGWALGCSVGSSAKKGDMKYYYQYAVVEQDAVFSPFAQDDLLLQTNHRSHIMGVNYQFLDDVGLHTWLLISSRDHRGTTPTTDSDNCQWRLRLDLNIRF